MPSKRPSSKQRRAAQNRATRAQREARREHAGVLRESAPVKAQANGSSGTGPVSGSGPLSGSPLAKVGEWFSGFFGGAPRSPEGDRADMPNDSDDAADDHEADDTGAADPGDAADRGESTPEPSATPARPERQNVNATGLVATLPDGTRLPGARATFVALVLAILAFSYTLVGSLVTVDDRGEPLPPQFHGLYLEARTLITGDEVEATQVTVAEAYGAAYLLLFLVPAVVVAFAWYTHRKTGLSRPLTFGMLALAVGVLFTGQIGQFFMPALIALAVGAFQARKAEMPARLAERAVAKGDKDEEKGDEDEE